MSLRSSNWLNAQMSELAKSQVLLFEFFDPQEQRPGFPDWIGDQQTSHDLEETVTALYREIGVQSPPSGFAARSKLSSSNL